MKIPKRFYYTERFDFYCLEDTDNPELVLLGLIRQELEISDILETTYLEITIIIISELILSSRIYDLDMD